MVIRLVSRLGLLKAVYSNVEAEVRLAVVLVGQAVESQGPAEWHLVTTGTLAGRRRMGLPGRRCSGWMGSVSCQGSAADQHTLPLSQHITSVVCLSSADWGAAASDLRARHQTLAQLQCILLLPGRSAGPSLERERSAPA